MSNLLTLPLVDPSLRLRAAAELERRQREKRRRSESFRTDPDALAAAAGFVPDPWQHDVLTSTAQTLLLNCGRQVGKSTIVAMVVVRAILTSDAMVVLVAPSERQSKELLRKILRFWRLIGRPIPHVSVTKTSLELANGARIEAFPASSETIVGMSAVTLLVADEASVVPDDLYYTLAPMLATSNGRVLAPSTPKGKRGWWFDLWQTAPADDPDIARVEVRSAECPRIPASFLARERRRVGDWWFQQEYTCVFQEALTAAFRTQDVESAFSEDVPFDRELFA